jgi:hypothetical protein
MKFDNVDFIQVWGGESGPGYHPPSNEAGMTVDPKGFVWIPENADGTRGDPYALFGVNSMSNPPATAETISTARPSENDPVRVFR